MQENQFDDELKRMDELEHDKSSGIGEGVSLDDSLSGLAKQSYSKITKTFFGLPAGRT